MSKLSGLKGHVLAVNFIISILVLLHVALVALWATQILQTHLFDISKIDVVTQAIAVASQLWIVTILAGLAFLFQRIAVDSAIRRRE